MLSARTPEQLRTLAERVADLAAGSTRPSLRELAYTSQIGRAEMHRRLTVLAGSLDELVDRLRAFVRDGEAPGVVTGAAGTGGSRDLLADGDGAAFVEALVDRRNLAKLSQVWVLGIPVDWRRLWPEPRPRRVTMPSYPFDRKRYWLPAESAESAESTGSAESVGSAEPAGSVDPAGSVNPAGSAESAGTASAGTASAGSTESAGSAGSTGSAEAAASAGVAESAGTECRYLRPAWERAPLGEETRDLRTVLVLGADDAPRTAVAAELAATGARCVLVTPGAGFEKQGEDAYVIDPGDRTDADRLIADLAERDVSPDAIVHVLSGVLPGDDGTALASELDRGFLPLLWTSTAILAHPGTGPLHVVVADVTVSDEPRPQHAALSAVLRTLALEHTRFSGVAVTLDEPAEMASRLAAELRGRDAASGAAPEERVTEVRYRGGARWRKHLERFTPVREGEPADLTLRPGGTYLITGGAGALGLAFAGFLAEHGPVNLVLAGRSDLEGETRAQVDALNRDGVSAAYIQADVGAPDDLNRLIAEIRERYGPLNGVIHAAGVNRDALAVRKTREEVDAVLASKVFGAVHLDEATRDEELDFLVLFSSVAAETGNLGQADYAYANAFLGHFAELRERRRQDGTRHGRTLAIGWPLWEEGGMAVDDATRRLFARRWGSVPMSTETGLRVFREGLAGAQTWFVVVESTLQEDRPQVVGTGAKTSTGETEAKAGHGDRYGDRYRDQRRDRGRARYGDLGRVGASGVAPGGVGIPAGGRGTCRPGSGPDGDRVRLHLAGRAGGEGQRAIRT